MTETSLKKKLWIVAVFSETRDYSVIPCNWLTEPIKENTSISYCKWPEYPVTSAHLQEAQNPMPNWDTYKIKILNGNKTYGNFNKAWYTHVKIKYSSTETDDIKTKKKPKFNTSSSDESYDLDPGYSIMPITSSASHAISVSETFNPATTNNENMVHYTNLLPISTLGTLTNNIPATVTSGALTNNIPATVTSGALTNNIPGTVTSNKSQDSQELLYSTNINDDLLSNFNELVSSQHNISELDSITPQSSFKSKTCMDPQHIDILEKINQGIVENNLMLRRLLAKMEVMERNQKINCTGGDIYLSPAFIAQFPIIDLDKFKLVEDCILNEPEYVPKLKSFIKTIGGTDLKNNVVRILSKLITNQYAITCSWTGRGKNIDTRIGDSGLMNSIKNVIKNIYSNNYTDSEFEKIVADWFRHANTRFSRTK